MNNYKFEDLKIGMVETFDRVITTEMMSSFLEITGDINPLHNDTNFACEKGYDSKVVYGMLTASLISTLGGVYLPGKNCLIHGVEVKFSKPVYIGDTLTISGIVEELHESVGQVVIKVVIKNQHGKSVCKGKLKAGVLYE